MCSFKKHEHVNRQQANNMTMAHIPNYRHGRSWLGHWVWKKTQQWVDTVPVLTMFMMAATSLLGSCQARFFPETHIHMSMYPCTHIHRISTHSVWLVNHTVFWTHKDEWITVDSGTWIQKENTILFWNKIKPFIFFKQGLSEQCSS